MDPWKLIEKRRYLGAIEAFTRRLRREPSENNYAGRAEAYFNLKDYNPALADFHAANAAAMHTSTHYLERIGVVNWLAGRLNTAAGTWLDLVLDTERGKIAYADGAGGVQPGCLLWFAAVSLGRTDLLTPARRLLEKKVNTKAGTNWCIENWPGPIAMFLLGALDESQLREKLIDVPIAHERELCQAEFYVGVKSLQHGDVIQARRAFRRSASLHDASIENEYDLAQREGRRRVPVATSC
jgi:tetratricopeptide (TPR) repeat protein